MFVKEIWRYPVKSTAGERIREADVGKLGIAGDRAVLVHVGGRLVTSRNAPSVAGLKGNAGLQWRSPNLRS